MTPNSFPNSHDSYCPTSFEVYGPNSSIELSIVTVTLSIKPSSCKTLFFDLSSSTLSILHRTYRLWVYLDSWSIWVDKPSFVSPDLTSAIGSSRSLYLCRLITKCTWTDPYAPVIGSERRRDFVGPYLSKFDHVTFSLVVWFGLLVPTHLVRSEESSHEEFYVNQSWFS